MFEQFKKYSKGITAAVGAIIVIINAFYGSKYDEQIAAVVSVLTALGVYLVPNRQEG